MSLLKNSRILITGGLGFVGSSIARRLLNEGAGNIVLFDVKKEPPADLEPFIRKGALKIMAGDIRQAEDVTQAVQGCDYVFHQAAIRVTQCAKEPRLGHEIMVDGTFNVAQAGVDAGVKKIIFASSAIVYGEPLYLPVDEKHPASDTTLYGTFKITNENLLRSFQQNHGLNYTVLRYFNIYGPGANIFGPEIEVLIRWLDRIDAGLPPLIFGDGKQMLDYIYIDDVVDANIKALLFPGSGEVFNVCTGKGTSVLELLQHLLAVTGSRLEPEFRESRSVNQVARRYGCPLKAKNILGFQASASLEDGLKKLVEWRSRILASKQ